MVLGLSEVFPSSSLYAQTRKTPRESYRGRTRERLLRFTLEQPAADATRHWSSVLVPHGLREVRSDALGEQSRDTLSERWIGYDGSKCLLGSIVKPNRVYRTEEGDRPWGEPPNTISSRC